MKMLRTPLFVLAFWAVFMFSCSPFIEDKEIEDAKGENVPFPTKEQLDKRYAAEWNKSVYQQAKTAKGTDYLTDVEKEVYYYLNLVRLNPALFARTYATGFEGDKGWSHGYAWDERKKSLIQTLSGMTAIGLIYPDEALFQTAHCFAYEGGKLGLVGHDRSQTSCAVDYHAECCTYGGAKNGLSIIMSFLIDAGENNAELGHRRILLDSRYDKLGAAIQPHSSYGIISVLDFKRK